MTEATARDNLRAAIKSGIAQRIAAALDVLRDTIGE